MDVIKFKGLLEDMVSLHDEDIQREEEAWKLENGTWRPHNQWKCPICNWIIDGANLLIGGERDEN